MKLAFVFGTRPEAIKMAPAIIQARRRPEIQPILIATGQHREMLRPILALFGFTPDVDLDLMLPGQALGGLTSRAVEAVSGVIAKDRPDAVVVQGDTTTAMCAALAAFYDHVPVAHIEAGLRSNRPDAPFPEEINRRIISQIAAWHLAPTARARQALLDEGIDKLGGRIVVTGNTVIDALLMALETVRSNPVDDPVCRRVEEHRADGGRVVLVTGHRRENFGEAFRSFCLGLRDIADAHKDVLVIYPVHLNPNVQAPVREILSDQSRVLLTAPADYPAFVTLMGAADLIITDSGGVQEEAPALGKPVLVTRETTERPEAVEAGAVRLVGTNRERLYREASDILAGTAGLRPIPPGKNPYGDGHAAERCIDAILGKPVREFAADG